MNTILDIFIMLAIIFVALPPIAKVLIFISYWIVIGWLVTYALFGGRA
jgi:hypothetical protein